MLKFPYPAVFKALVMGWSHRNLNTD